MNRMRLLQIVNIALLVVIAVQVVTGLTMFFGLSLAVPPVVHRYNALLLTALAAAHVWLNGSWIRANLFR